tara:strand:- start:39736 stop:41019 length:1284 start_codon:yes stop_codon:yes gene_type:complete
MDTISEPELSGVLSELFVAQSNLPLSAYNKRANLLEAYSNPFFFDHIVSWVKENKEIFSNDVLRVQLLIKERQQDKAATLIERMVLQLPTQEKDPVGQRIKECQLPLLRGQLKELKGEWREAAEYYRRVAAVPEVKEPFACILLGDLYRSKKMALKETEGTFEEESNKWYEKALSSTPEGAPAYGLAAYRLGEYYEKSDTKIAQSFYKHAIEAETIIEHYLPAYAKMGELSGNFNYYLMGATLGSGACALALVNAYWSGEIPSSSQQARFLNAAQWARVALQWGVPYLSVAIESIKEALDEIPQEDQHYYSGARYHLTMALPQNEKGRSPDSMDEYVRELYFKDYDIPVGQDFARWIEEVLDDPFIKIDEKRLLFTSLLKKYSLGKNLELALLESMVAALYPTPDEEGWAEFQMLLGIEEGVLVSCE